jgi:hypothetical protein
MGRRFHLWQAEALLAELEGEVRLAMSLRDDLARVVSSLAAIARHVSLSGGAVIDRKGVADTRARREALTGRLKEVIETVHERGCLIKDLEAGLVDFPTVFNGREVYLCWQVGEDGIHYWHEVEDGFRGRKPIDREFMENHRGDPAG